MRIAVVSDSHGQTYSIERALSTVGEYDAVIHLGDFAADGEAVCEKLGKPLYAVLGNCDFIHPPKGNFSHELLIELEGAKLLLTHGHRHGVDSFSTWTARERALKLGADALLYGHTHVPEVSYKDGLLVMNPGSTSQPRGRSMPTVGLLVIENGRIVPRTYAIK